jgi:hypothetical protein
MLQLLLMTLGCPALRHLSLRKYVTDVFVVTKVTEQMDKEIYLDLQRTKH